MNIVKKKKEVGKIWKWYRIIRSDTRREEKEWKKKKLKQKTKSEIREKEGRLMRKGKKNEKERGNWKC